MDGFKLGENEGDTVVSAPLGLILGFVVGITEGT